MIQVDKMCQEGNSAQLRALPLKRETPSSWATAVLESPLALLIDHAHLERKASQNALSLLHQWPEGTPPNAWTEALSEISRDESQHLALVLRILHSRGGELTRSSKNSYAQRLKTEIRTGSSPDELVDKLLVSALIEARSCERFKLLSEATGGDRELQKLYTGLWSSEHDHYRVFLELAYFIDTAERVNNRFDWYLKYEADVISRQPTGPFMHSWVGQGNAQHACAKNEKRADSTAMFTYPIKPFP